MGLPENKSKYDAIKPEKKQKAILFLQNYLDKKVTRQIRNAIANDPKLWFTPYHFHWGMSIRNVLRQNDLGEKFLEVGNLDDVYVELVEDAVKEDWFEKQIEEDYNIVKTWPKWMQKIVVNAKNALSGNFYDKENK